MSSVQFLLDENVPTEIARQLKLSGIDAITVRDLGRLGDTDSNHLQFATDEGRVLCTHDPDFLQLAAEGVEHAGIAFSPQNRVSIGGWVRALRAMHAQYSAEEARNRVFFLSL